MATLLIPSLMADLTGGETVFEAPASTVSELLAALEQMYPGTHERLVPSGRLRTGIAVAVDGEISHRGISTRVEKDSMVRLLPAVKGG